MDAEQKKALVKSQTAAALITAMGMQAENEDRIQRGHSIAYTENEFVALIERFGLGHNQVVKFLEGQ